MPEKVEKIKGHLQKVIDAAMKQGLVPRQPSWQSEDDCQVFVQAVVWSPNQPLALPQQLFPAASNSKRAILPGVPSTMPE